MTTFKHILVATDFEAPSARALDVAIDLARVLGAELTVVHVWELPTYSNMEFMLNSEAITSAEDRAVNGLADNLAHARKKLPSAQSRLEQGAPLEGILEAIKQTGADLVVMGTHGRRGVAHVMLGSVAEKLVRVSPIPVLTVHPAPVD